MRRARKLNIAAATIAIAVTAVAAAPAPARQLARPAATKTTMLYDVAPGFFPGTLSVKAGTRLVWKSDRSNDTEHTVTLDAKPRKAKFFDSGDIGPGRSYSRTLKVKGSYGLYCKIHAGMFQTVKVR